MTVIDASSAVAYCLKEEGWERVRDLLTQRPRSPEVLSIECANAILKARRQRRISPEQASAAIERLGAVNETGVRFVPHKELLSPAIAIAQECGIAAYDSIYLALARQEGVPLATRDRPQAEAALRLAIRVVET